MPGNQGAFELVLPVELLAGFLFIVARLTSIIALTPLAGFRNVPGVAKVMLILALAVLLLPAVTLPPGGASISPFWWLGSEFALGATCAAVIGWFAESMVVAMQLVNLQAGFSYASTIDPTTQADSTVLQTVGLLFAGMLFFAIGADRALIRVLAESFVTVPVGTFVLKSGWAAALAGWSSSVLVTAIRLALPVVTLLLLFDLTLGLLARVHAQMQFQVLSMPIKTVAAMALLASGASVAPVLYERSASEGLELLRGWIIERR